MAEQITYWALNDGTTAWYVYPNSDGELVISDVEPTDEVGVWEECVYTQRPDDDVILTADSGIIYAKLYGSETLFEDSCLTDNTEDWGEQYTAEIGYDADGYYTFESNGVSDATWIQYDISDEPATYRVSFEVRDGTAVGQSVRAYYWESHDVNANSELVTTSKFWQDAIATYEAIPVEDLATISVWSPVSYGGGNVQFKNFKFEMFREFYIYPNSDGELIITTTEPS